MTDCENLGVLGSECDCPQCHWRRRAETAEARVAELGADLEEALNQPMATAETLLVVNAGLREDNARLREALESGTDILNGCQKILTMYLEPGDTRIQTERQAVNALLDLIDGPKWRAMAKLSNAALAAESAPDRAPLDQQLREARAAHELAVAALSKMERENDRLREAALMARSLLTGDHIIEDMALYGVEEVVQTLNEALAAESATPAPSRIGDTNLTADHVMLALVELRNIESDLGLPEFKGHRENLLKANRARAAYAISILEAVHSATPAPSPWRDIESAPSDGTEIIIFAEGIVGEGLYVGTNSAVHPDCYGWRFRTGTRSVDPTHWMPLPPAPETEGESNE